MRDRSKFRRIIVTLHPAGFIGLRLEKCRHEETLSIRAAYETAVQTRVRRKQADLRKGKPLPCQARPPLTAARNLPPNHEILDRKK